MPILDPDACVVGGGGIAAAATVTSLLVLAGAGLDKGRENMEQGSGVYVGRAAER